jgi:PRTRC genetic system protein B
VSQQRLMFLGDGNQETRKLNGKMYPHPALVFMIHGRDLFVRALAEDCRPKANTRLKSAPHWNTDSQGRVCLGSMRVPDEVNVNSLAGWETAYFASEFTHPSGAVRLTTHPKGFLGLWSNLMGKKRSLPVEFLADCKETRQEFLQRKGER